MGFRKHRLGPPIGPSFQSNTKRLRPRIGKSPGTQSNKLGAPQSTSTGGDPGVIAKFALLARIDRGVDRYQMWNVSASLQELVLGR